MDETPWSTEKIGIPLLENHGKPGFRPIVPRYRRSCSSQAKVTWVAVSSRLAHSSYSLSKDSQVADDSLGIPMLDYNSLKKAISVAP